MMRKKLGLAFLLSLGIVATTTLGFSSWVIPALNFVASPKGDNSAKAVAYVESSGKRYASVEGAVQAANSLGGTQNVYVIPGVSFIGASEDGDFSSEPIVVRESFVISPGVSLILPFGISNGAPQVINDRAAGSGFADSSVSNIAANLKTEVLLDEGVTVTIEPGATLTIGGSIGESGNLIGAELGQYAQISMAAGSNIICNGNINVYGYIKPFTKAGSTELISPKITIRPKNGSIPNVLVPLVAYDFSSGSVLLDRYNQKLFPFNVYDIPNITVPYDVYYGAAFKGTTSFNLGISQLNINVPFNPVIDLIGTANSSAIIKLLSGDSYVSVDNQPGSQFNFKYQGEDYVSDLTINDRSSPNSKGYYSVYGNCEISNLSFELLVTEGSGLITAGTINAAIKLMLGSNTLTTSGMFLPFPYKWDITINGTVTFPSDIQAKFLPGSRFNVNPGATWNLNGKAIFYDSSSTINSMYPSSKLPSSYALNNGTINVNNAIGGKIETSSDGAQLNFSRCQSFSVVSNEEGGNVELKPLIELKENDGTKLTYEVNSSDANKLFYGHTDENSEFGYFEKFDVFIVTISSKTFIADDSRTPSFEVSVINGAGTETKYEPVSSGTYNIVLPSGDDYKLRIYNSSGEVGYILNESTGEATSLINSNYHEIIISSSTSLSVVPKETISFNMKASIDSEEIAPLYRGNKSTFLFTIGDQASDYTEWSAKDYDDSFFGTDYRVKGEASFTISNVFVGSILHIDVTHASITGVSSAVNMGGNGDYLISQDCYSMGINVTLYRTSRQ